MRATTGTVTKNKQVSFYMFSFCAILLECRLENVHHFSDLHKNFQFNLNCDTQYMTAVVFFGRLPESDITVTLSVTCMDWLHQWYITWLIYFPSVVLAFLASVGEKCNLHHWVHSKWIVGKRQSVLKRNRWNKSTWKRFTNCGHTL